MENAIEQHNDTRGQHFGIYPSPSAKWGKIFFGILNIGLGVGLAIGLSIFLPSQISGWNEIKNEIPYIAYTPFVAGGFLGLVGIMKVLPVFLGWSPFVSVYENGMEYSDFRGKRVILWTEIDGLYQNIVRHYYSFIPVGTTYTYTLTTRDGETFVFDNRFGNVKELGSKLQEALVHVFWPGYLNDFEAGKRLEFGPFSLDKTSIYMEKKQLPWAEIARVELNKGVFSLKKKGGKFGSWGTAKVQNIPNFYIFYSLIKEQGITE